MYMHMYIYMIHMYMYTYIFANTKNGLSELQLTMGAGSCVAVCYIV